MQCSNAISVILLATHYIFNMAYHLMTNDIVMFLQHKVTKVAQQQVEHSGCYSYCWNGSLIQIFHSRGDGHLN